MRLSTTTGLLARAAAGLAVLWVLATAVGVLHDGTLQVARGAHPGNAAPGHLATEVLHALAAPLADTLTRLERAPAPTVPLLVAGVLAVLGARVLAVLRRA